MLWYIWCMWWILFEGGTFNANVQKCRVPGPKHSTNSLSALALPLGQALTIRRVFWPRHSAKPPSRQVPAVLPLHGAIWEQTFTECYVEHSAKLFRVPDITHLAKIFAPRVLFAECNTRWIQYWVFYGLWSFPQCTNPPADMCHVQYEVSNSTAHPTTIWHTHCPLAILLIQYNAHHIYTDASLYHRPVRLAYQPLARVLFSQNKPANNNKPTVLFS
jgi:hypothetical protein